MSIAPSRRFPSALLAMLLASVLAVALLLVPAPAHAANTLDKKSNQTQVQAVFDQINKFRADNKLPALRFSPSISGIPQDWVNGISSRGVVEHSTTYASDSRAAGRTNWGEIIAWAGGTDATALVNWWKNSPDHKALMLKTNFNVMGIGISFTTSGQLWGVVNFYQFSPLPADTYTSPAQICGKITSPAGAPCVTASAAGSTTAPQSGAIAPISGSAAISSAADVIAVDSAGTLWNYPATGTGGFRARQKLATGWLGLKKGFVTDWNGDGTLDILAQWNDGELTLHAGKPGGGFESSFLVGQSGWAGMTITVGRWSNADALPGIVGYDASGNLWWYRNPNGTTHALAQLIGQGWQGLGITMVDFDGDGSQDLLAKLPDGRLLNYRTNGAGAFRSEARPAVGSGWGPFDSQRILQGWNGPGSRGMLTRYSNGDTFYYPLRANGWSPRSQIGSGWNGFQIFG